MNKKTSTGLLLFLLAALIGTYFLPKKRAEVKANQFNGTIDIPKLMQAQTESWNKGDLEGFMSLYLKTDTLMFMSSRNSYFGWQTLFDSYNKSYWTDDNRGELNFIIDKVIPIDDALKSYVVPGKWEVSRKDTVLSGKFSLIFKHYGEIGWKIIADHTW